MRSLGVNGHPEQCDFRIVKREYIVQHITFIATKKRVVIKI